MNALKAGFLLNALAATMVLAAPTSKGGSRVSKVKHVAAAVLTHTATGKRGAASAPKRNLAKKDGKRTLPRPATSSKPTDSETTLTTLARLTRQLEEANVAIAALTTHDLAPIKAPPKGKAVKHRAFFDLNGRATVAFADAADGDIFSIDGEWHTVDYSPTLPSLGSFARGMNNAVVIEATQANDVSVDATPYMRAHQKFATPALLKVDGGIWKGFTVGSANEATSSSAEVRRAHAQAQYPSVRIFRAATARQELTIQRVGRVRAERLIHAQTDYSPTVIPAVANDTFKFMPIIGGTSMLEVSFMSTTTGQESIVGIVKLGETLPLVAKAKEAGAYIARSKLDPSVKNPPRERAPIFLRVEQAFVTQTSDQLVAEYRDLKTAYMGTPHFDFSIFRFLGVLPDVIR